MTGSDPCVPEKDAALVTAVLAGDAAAFAELHDRYARLVRAICFDATGDLTQAQDLAQEVFLRAYRRLGALRYRMKFARWLVGIARRVGKEWRRARSRDRHRYVGLNPPDDAATEPADTMPFEALRGALQSLPARERLALHIFYLQGQPADVAGVVLGLSRSGLYRLLERARRRLGQRMQAYDREAR